jgi:hypothetical protein
LADLHFRLVELLHGVDIHPVSLASDGTETERKLQRIIESRGHSSLIYAIPNAIPKLAFTLSIPLFYGFPSVVCQDSKHGSKTARNQLLTGARLITLGNFPCHYAQLREFAYHPKGPLFHRDIEKLDRQDDRAAARLFSAESLSFHTREYPLQTGLSIFLYVFGEITDAWQNRHIAHIERAKIAMRTRFFILAWRNHIMAHPDHSTNTHFISRESYDIFITICESLLSLIIVYRKWYSAFPFLPWLHSTEICEHLFGMLRQLKKDFNYSDMLYLEPKLRTLMLGSFGNLSFQAQANATAAGYYHSCSDVAGLDIPSLMSYPSDREIGDASDAAFEEAALLLAAVGINAKDMLLRDIRLAQAKSKSKVTKQSPRPTTLYELTMLHQHSPASIETEDKVDTVSMAIIADRVDKTLSM